MNKQRLEQFLNYTVENGGSDLHLKAGSAPHVRINGELFPIQSEVLSNADVENLARAILPPEIYEKLMEEKEIDHFYLLDNRTRFRVNLFYQINGLSIAMRAIPVEIPTIRELRLPESIAEFADQKEGLILMTGPTGSGKSTTVASLIDLMNKKYRRHIITIEDPIEFVFREDKSIISQRAIGENSRSFKHALTAAFREDFDVLFIGEIRDYETMEIALHAANTGHLVLSTLHTKGSAETIGRIVNMFPADSQQQVRSTLSEILIGIISQRLVATRQNRLIPAVEIMKNTARISEIISQGRDSEIIEAISKGSNSYGMQTLDQALAEYFRSGQITSETMLQNASNPSDLKLMTEGIVA